MITHFLKLKKLPSLIEGGAGGGSKTPFTFTAPAVILP
jgi:hypothetical protein